MVVGKGYQVFFDEQGSVISNKITNKVLLNSKQKGDMFTLDMKPIVGFPSICLLSNASLDLCWLWQRSLSHLNFKNANKLVLNDFFRVLHVLKLENNSLCVTCEQGKQQLHGHPIVIESKIVQPLELLHIDICGSLTIKSIGRKKYILVIVDEFSCFTWVYFLRPICESAQVMIDFIKIIMVSLKKIVRKIRSDNGTKFRNHILDSFLIHHGISHNIPSTYTPQKWIREKEKSNLM